MSGGPDQRHTARVWLGGGTLNFDIARKSNRLGFCGEEALELTKVDSYPLQLKLLPERENYPVCIPYSPLSPCLCLTLRPPRLSRAISLSLSLSSLLLLSLFYLFFTLLLLLLSLSPFSSHPRHGQASRLSSHGAVSPCLSSSSDCSRNAVALQSHSHHEDHHHLTPHLIIQYRLLQDLQGPASS